MTARHTRQHVAEPQAPIVGRQYPDGTHLHTFQHDYAWGKSRAKWRAVVWRGVDGTFPETAKPVPDPKPAPKPRRTRSDAARQLFAEQERAMRAVHKVAEPEPAPVVEPYPVSEPQIPAHVVTQRRRKRQDAEPNRVSRNDPRLSMDDLLEILGDDT